MSSMSQSANESERQSRKQKLVSPDPDPESSQSKKQKLVSPDPDPDPESLQGQGQIPDFPPNADELRKRGKLIWHWDDSDDDEFEDFPGKAEAQTDDKPKTGRWFCLQPHTPPFIYCRILKKSDDHMTKQCPRFGMCYPPFE